MELLGRDNVMAPFSTRSGAKDDGEEITKTCEKKNVCKLKATYWDRPMPSFKHTCFVHCPCSNPDW